MIELWHYVVVSKSSDKEFDTQIDWCHEAAGLWTTRPLGQQFRGFRFELKEDAIRFLLTFSGEYCGMYVGWLPIYQKYPVNPNDNYAIL